MNKKKTPLSHKIATIISCLAGVVWLIYQVQPDLFPIDPTSLAIAVFTVCEAVVCWKQKRTWSWLLIAGSVICIACFLLEQIL